jgi:alpha-beta hydrolase superfamily lysophospholipase
MIPVVIPTPGGDCFAAYHWAPGPAVLICPPFGYEALATARAWRDLAERLAANGTAALRLDLPGTGDSAGWPTDPGQVAAWRGAIDAAWAWLAARHAGCVTLLGQRFGALLALDAVARGIAADRLVLLDPPVSGAAYARGLRARARLEGHGPANDGPGYIQAWDVPIAPETLKDMASLPAAAAPATPLPPTLLAMPAARDDRADWPQPLRDQPASVTAIPYDGYGDFVLQDWLRTRSPVAVFRRIVAFLAAPTLPCLAPPEPSPLIFPHAREEYVRFGADRGLFGILCRATNPVSDAPAVLLPSTGALPRSGKSRIWTDLARRLAARGVSSLRFDLRHVAESSGAADIDMLVASYAPERVSDIVAAADALTDRGLPGAILIGHCSGAYTAWLAALADRRIIGVLASNPQFLARQSRLSYATLHRRPGVAEHQDHLLPSPAGQSQAAPTPQRPVQPGIGHLLAERARRACPRTLRHVLRRFGHEERQARQGVRHLLSRGCVVQLTYSTGDYGLSRLRRSFGEVPRLPEGLRLTVIDGADHNFTARRHRAAWLDAATGFALRVAVPRQSHGATFSPAQELQA